MRTGRIPVTCVPGGDQGEWALFEVENEGRDQLAGHWAIGRDFDEAAEILISRHAGALPLRVERGRLASGVDFMVFDSYTGGEVMLYTTIPEGFWIFGPRKLALAELARFDRTGLLLERKHVVRMTLDFSASLDMH